MHGIKIFSIRCFTFDNVHSYSVVLLVCTGDDKEITAPVRANPEPETHRKEGQQQGVIYVGLFSYACPQLRNRSERVVTVK
jgi:hypothetical protein